jgi:hypothetical protein
MESDVGSPKSEVEAEIPLWKGTESEVRRPD